jgi:hypothetical protein
VNDREKAKRLREKGWNGPSASEKAREKGTRSGRSGRRSEPASGGIVEALRNFDPNRPNETAVPRSEESKSRARTFKSRLPGLG